ncbi:G-protein coupled receptors family 3 profile domain-containing protein [Plasmodiophora brassicae]|uniref:G-protein coupled receptors family 3 profile domain-containing protein n=1 Tax=Plasmodiophora brassicae TaxID=37360 RepID=A0A0G4IQD6_PLABS|nr:hypothetical protein PBRA_000772 [Plasmodiophora brassicae]SPQ97738.1 unnamed protein product [Plasmodiophora brassicae]
MASWVRSIVVIAIALTTADALTLADGSIIATYDFPKGRTSPFVVNATCRFVASDNDMSGATDRIAIVTVHDTAVNVDTLASTCLSAGCRALALYTPPSTLLQTALELTAWQYVPRNPFPIPIVVLGRADPQQIARLQTDAFVQIASGEFENPAGIALTSIPVKALLSFNVVIFSATILSGFFKLLCFGISSNRKPRAIPFLALLLLGSILLFAAFGLVPHVNLVVFNGQGLPWAFFLYFSYADYGLYALARLAVGLTGQSSAKAATAASKTQTIILHVLLTATVAGTAIAFVAPVVFTGLGRVPLGIVVATGLFMVPGVFFSVMNSRSFVSLVKSLRSPGKNLGVSGLESAARTKFTWRGALALLCGYCTLLGQIVFLSTQHTSPWHYLVARGFEKLAASTHGLCGILLLRNPPSALDLFNGTSTKQSGKAGSVGTPHKAVIVTAKTKS